MSAVRNGPRRQAREEVGKPPVTVDLQLRPGEASNPVGRLVAAGVASRLGMQVDRIEELQLAIDAALRQPAAGDALTVSLTLTGEDLVIRLGPLAVTPVERSGVERVLSALVDEIETYESERDVWIAMRVSRSPLGSASR